MDIRKSRFGRSRFTGSTANPALKSYPADRDSDPAEHGQLHRNGFDPTYANWLLLT